jgi:hypothetical protein
MNALGPTSTHAAALLLHAAEQFSQRVPSAHDSVRAIRPELAGAVDVLVDAAGREWDGVWQRKLMNVSPTRPILQDFIELTCILGCRIWPRVFRHVRSN